MRVFLVIAAFMFTTYAGNTWQADGKPYRIVCDPTKTARFAAKTGCAYIELAMWDYIAANDNPCDNTKAGRYLRDFLGAACTQKLGLRVSEETYRRVESCDTKARELASVNACEEKFESQ